LLKSSGSEYSHSDMTNSLASLSVVQLKRAIDLKEKIEALNKELSSILGAPASESPSAKPVKRGGMSAAGRARIAAAQKARWAKVKGVKADAAPVAAKPVAKKKFTMSASAKAAISKAAKARWAKIKAAKKK